MHTIPLNSDFLWWFLRVGLSRSDFIEEISELGMDKSHAIVYSGYDSFKNGDFVRFDALFNVVGAYGSKEPNPDREYWNAYVLKYWNTWSTLKSSKERSHV